MMRLPPSSTRTGTLLPYATLCRSVGTAGLASLLTAPASSLPLATTVFGGGSTGAGACCRQPAGSRQAIARQDSNDGKRNRAGITTWGLCGFLGVLVYGPDPSAPQCEMNTPSRRKARHATGVRALVPPRPYNPPTPNPHAPTP